MRDPRAKASVLSVEEDIQSLPSVEGREMGLQISSGYFKSASLNSGWGSEGEGVEEAGALYIRQKVRF